MISLRGFTAFFFIIYAISIPIFAENFYNSNVNTSFYIILSCCIISFLLYSGRVFLFNILIAFYIFKQYLTRPYVDIFHHQLNSTQLEYILNNDSFFTSAGAEVVFLSLLSLLIAWTIGLFIVKPTKSIQPLYPWIFKEIDRIITTPRIQLVLVWSTLSVSTYISFDVLFRSAIAGASKPLFAFGLLSVEFITLSCLLHYVYSKHIGAIRTFPILLIPVIILVASSIYGGGRGALYNIVVMVFLYWVFLNFNRNITYKDLRKFFVLILTIPFVFFIGLIAQAVKHIRKSNILENAPNQSVYDSIILNFNFFNLDNPAIASLYFGLTEIIHRLSHLQAQFLILNDHYINKPSETFNLTHMFMRVINDLIPGSLFNDVISINRLFHHIYLDEFVNYSSHTWGIQGTMYLLFGFIGSLFFVFILALLISKYYGIILNLAKSSPTFYLFLTLFILSLLENGTLERVVVVDVVRPLVIIIFFILSIKLLNFLSLLLNNTLTNHRNK